MSPLRLARREGRSLLVYVGGEAKVDIGLTNVGQQETKKATQYYWKTPWGGLSKAQASNKVQSFPETLENMSHQEN